ncbi:MAG: DUF3883 domain-containing protein [Gemmatimonadetes bacterium]|nr:DUF3883 domain-containing protein [Gemmatimonadota bacterium]
MTASRADRRDWPEIEVEATITDYFAMLVLELRGESFNKAERNRALQQILAGRSHGAVERKHQNISAILIEEALPYVEGYKPLGNYQELLREAVLDRIPRTPELLELVRARITAQVNVPGIDDILRALTEPPSRPATETRARQVGERPRPSYSPRPNYLLMEAQNSALGRAGEQFVVNFERARLIAEGEPGLADNVEHVSVTRGDHLGYDIHSFGPGHRVRWIEVKTTSFGAHTPFYVTRNELAVSREASDRYHVYRVFGFRRDPGLFLLPGAIDSKCQLDPDRYIAQPA